MFGNTVEHWEMHDLVNHLVGVNLVFAAIINDQAPPEHGADHLGDDPVRAYHDSGVALQTALDQPGVLDRTYHGQLWTATGAERLQLRLADLLAHGWDLAQATGQPADLPEDLAEQALTFARKQLSTQPRTDRFAARCLTITIGSAHRYRWRCCIDLPTDR